MDGIAAGGGRRSAHDALHPPGRSQAGLLEIREGRAVFETQMLKAEATALDGKALTAVVADELLTLAAARPAPLDSLIPACRPAGRWTGDGRA